MKKSIRDLIERSLIGLDRLPFCDWESVGSPSIPKSQQVSPVSYDHDKDLIANVAVCLHHY